MSRGKNSPRKRVRDPRNIERPYHVEPPQQPVINDPPLPYDLQIIAECIAVAAVAVGACVLFVAALGG